MRSSVTLLKNRVSSTTIGNDTSVSCRCGAAAGVRALFPSASLALFARPADVSDPTFAFAAPAAEQSHAAENISNMRHATRAARGQLLCSQQAAIASGKHSEDAGWIPQNHLESLEKKKEEDISGQKCVVRSSPSHSLAQPWPSRGWPRSSARPQPSRLPRVRFLVSQYSDDSIQGACDARPVPLLGGAVQVGNSIGKAKSLGAVGMGSDDCN